jgi:hypothetical protein
MRSRAKVTRGLLLAGALVFGAFQAVQASEVFRQANCPEQGNWCAESRGADDNCKQCCGNPDSICAFYSEDPVTPPFPQGCVRA